MDIQWKRIVQFFALILATIALISCSNSGESKLANSSIPTDLLNKPGVWKLNLDANLGETTTFDGVTSRVEARLALLDVMSVDDSGGQNTEKTCDEFPPETAQPIAPNESPFTDVGIGASQACPNETTAFSQINSNTYRITYSCSNGNSATLLFTHLTSTPGFNFGNLRFTSTMNPDLNASSGVCGSFESSDMTQTVTPQPNRFNIANNTLSENIFSIMAPYNGNYLLMTFNFADTIRVATYTTVNPAHVSQPDEIGVGLLSTTYGGTASNPGSSYATGGSVTIEAISSYAARGTFNLTTDEGDNLTGTFNFDIGPS